MGAVDGYGPEGGEGRGEEGIAWASRSMVDLQHACMYSYASMSTAVAACKPPYGEDEIGQGRLRNGV